MNKVLKLLFVFIFITNCSFHENSKFWNKEKLTTEKKENNNKLFKKKESINVEFNQNLKITIPKKLIYNNFSQNQNNYGRYNYSGKFENKSKYKFSRIKDFHQYEPEIVFDNNNVIFFDNKGTILKFDQNSKLIWKKNYYSKKEKKQNPILFFASTKDYLIVADTLSKFYMLDINSGEILWSKKSSAPFNSQIKIYKDKFFTTDFENILRGHNIKDGEEVFKIKTENSLIRSQKKLSLVIVDEKIYFNNSLGDISAVDINSSQLIWQTPTQSSQVYNESFFLKTSDIVADNNSLYFSNNKNEFYSLDIETGSLNWKQDVNSNLRPIIIDDYIFSISTKGYLIIIQKITGNIIRINNIFKVIKNNKKNNIVPTGFAIATNSIYVTTSNGRLLEIDLETGKNKSTIKVDGDIISKPSILNNAMYIITDNSIIRLD